MGFFDWFRRRELLDVVCWLDAGSRWRGLTKSVAADVAVGRHVVVVAHFKQALSEVGEHLAHAGIPFEATLQWSKADLARLAPGASTVTLAPVTALPKADPERRSAPVGAPAVSVCAVDVHVLAAENDRVLHFAAALPGGGVACAHVALDDPLLAAFAKPWVRDFMIKLGMSADEPIRSGMVTKGMHRALAKLAQKATGAAVATDSAQEWVERNLSR